MITEQDIQNALLESINEKKIPYTQDGFEILLTELKKKIPENKYEIKIESIKETSVQDRAEQRKAPKITVTIRGK